MLYDSECFGLMEIKFGTMKFLKSCLALELQTSFIRFLCKTRVRFLFSFVSSFAFHQKGSVICPIAATLLLNSYGFSVQWHIVFWTIYLVYLFTKKHVDTELRFPHFKSQIRAEKRLNSVDFTATQVVEPVWHFARWANLLMAWNIRE